MGQPLEVSTTKRCTCTSPLLGAGPPAASPNPPGAPARSSSPSPAPDREPPLPRVCPARCVRSQSVPSFPVLPFLCASSRPSGSISSDAASTGTLASASMIGSVPSWCGRIGSSGTHGAGTASPRTIRGARPCLPSVHTACFAHGMSLPHAHTLLLHPGPLLLSSLPEASF